MFSAKRGPLIVEPGAPDRNLAEQVALNRDFVTNRLLEHGALLFRGFGVHVVEEFDCFVGSLACERLDYTYRSTPRTALGNRIFTATEYPASQEIPLHNENAYQLEWPMKLALCCLVPAASGGETPLADMREVTASIGATRLDEFDERRVRYVRHYHPFVDLPWQTVFQTDDRETVARLCRELQIEHEWLEVDLLRTTQVSQGAARHPVTGERVFFNQAHLFHRSSLGEMVARSMAAMLGAERLPRQTFFGDGAPLRDPDLAAIRTAFAAASQSFQWQRGDVLLLDNMKFAHGRRPFTGARKVVAALLEPQRASGMEARPDGGGNRVIGSHPANAANGDR